MKKPEPFFTLVVNEQPLTTEEYKVVKRQPRLIENYIIADMHSLSTNQRSKLISEIPKSTDWINEFKSKHKKPKHGNLKTKNQRQCFSITRCENATTS